MIFGHHAYCARVPVENGVHVERPERPCTCGMDGRRCETHGVPIQSHEPTGCPQCGAPQCCPVCCKEAGDEAFLFGIAESLDAADIGCRDGVWANAYHTMTTADTRRLLALARVRALQPSARSDTKTEAAAVYIILAQRFPSLQSAPVVALELIATELLASRRREAGGET